MEAIERYSTSNDLLTIVVVLLLVLLVMAKKGYQHRFDDFVSLFGSSKFLVIKSREHKALFGFNVIMLIVHILSLSLFLFVLYRLFISPVLDNTWVVFLRILTAYTFFVLLKITTEKIIANVFDIDELAEHYLFQKHTFRNLISLLLLPLTVFIIYAPLTSTSIIYVITGLFILTSIIVSFRIIKKNIGMVSRNWFYFILYLCALEITPYLILYKLFTNSEL